MTYDKAKESGKLSSAIKNSLYTETSSWEVKKKNLL